MMQITLNKYRTFQMLSIPFSEEKQNELEQDILQNGCKKPIIFWRGMIIDGHKRYSICREEGIEFAIEEKKFKSEEEAVIWLCREKIPTHRTASPAYRYLVGKLYNTLKKIYLEERSLAVNDQTLKLNGEYNSILNPIPYYLASELHLHFSSIKRYSKYATSIEQIYEKSWKTFQAIMIGNLPLSYDQILECAMMDEQQLRNFVRKKMNVTAKNSKINNSGSLMAMQKKENTITISPLSVGVKEMPKYDPDMELKGLSLTIPTWILFMERVKEKTATATVDGKMQLAKSLYALKLRIDELLGVMEK